MYIKFTPWPFYIFILSNLNCPMFKIQLSRDTEFYFLTWGNFLCLVFFLHKQVTGLCSVALLSLCITIYVPTHLTQFIYMYIFLRAYIGTRLIYCNCEWCFLIQMIISPWIVRYSQGYRCETWPTGEKNIYINENPIYWMFIGVISRRRIRSESKSGHLKVGISKCSAWWVSKEPTDLPPSPTPPKSM